MRFSFGRKLIYISRVSWNEPERNKAKSYLQGDCILNMFDAMLLQLLEDVLKELKELPEVKANLLEVRLNGKFGFLASYWPTEVPLTLYEGPNSDPKSIVI